MPTPRTLVALFEAEKRTGRVKLSSLNLPPGTLDKKKHPRRELALARIRERYPWPWQRANIAQNEPYYIKHHSDDPGLKRNPLQ